MDDAAMGRLLYLLRRHAPLTQRELGARIGVSQDVISLLERGHMDRTSLRTVRSAFAPFGVSVRLDPRGRGAALDHLGDAEHARLVQAVAKSIAIRDWEVHVEVTYSEFGERGAIDILLLRRVARKATVIEVKSELVAVDATLRKLDEKVRLAPKIVRDRAGWTPVHVARILVLPADSTSRRRVERHAAIFDQALPARTRATCAWLKDPHGSLRGIWFLADTTGRRQRRH